MLVTLGSRLAFQRLPCLLLLTVVFSAHPILPTFLCLVISDSVSATVIEMLQRF